MVDSLATGYPTRSHFNKSQPEKGDEEGAGEHSGHVIFQEIFHYIKHTKGRTSFVAIKLDMAKAYDGLEWSFLRALFDYLGFGKNWGDFNNYLISSSSFYTKLYGSTFDFFEPSRGIRQGCSPSHFLFIVAMEALWRLLTTYGDLNLFKGIKVARRAPETSHLFFVDDTFLFYRTTLEDISTIKCSLDLFSDLSGLALVMIKVVYLSVLMLMPLPKLLYAILGISEMKM
ncbi:uncharacterized protein LOC122086914 [Macadamia integrifolia]|uniref:uncharacterized protein LOC122086914 n=1 Tax=Macadamia integrifolia TaxID=60698 RepID=UPI001C4F085A|nr:uncharacterized protein LOC122086914 [Macadamia integrifolia]